MRSLKALALAAMLACAPVFAQTFGEINGSVTDSSGAVTAGAKVTVTNAATGVPREVESNESGNYAVPFLNPGIYSITAELDGFKTARVDGRQGGERANQPLSISGRRQQFNRFTLDGIDNTDSDLNTFVVRPSVEALQEFKVQTGVSPFLDNPTNLEFFAKDPSGRGAAAISCNVAGPGGVNQLSYRQGNIARNMYIGPGFGNWDFAVSKNFRVTEGSHVEFRFESFNFENHPQWNNPDTGASSLNYGRITSARDMRTNQFALKYIF